MHIVLVGTAYPLRGGIAHYIALLYKKLIAQGHRVEVLSFKRQYPSFLFPGLTQKDKGKELIPIDSVPLLDSINPLTWIKSFFWLKNIKPDIILFKYWMPFFAPCYATIASMARYLLRVQVLYICDNIVPHEKKPGDKLLSKIGLKFVDSFIVQSKTVLKDLLTFRPDAVYREIPHPVYEIFPPPIPKKEARKKLKIIEDNVILYFGYIRAYKGLRYLIQAMPIILKNISAKLLICGEFYEGQKETLNLIRKLNLKNAVIVYDNFIPNEEVNLYFSATDLVALPYVSATQSGIVQIAYYYNRPVVATNVGGLPEVIINGKTGYVVPPQDPEALADSIVKFYREKKEKAFAENIEMEKKKYSWDRMIRAIEELGGMSAHGN